MNLNELIMGVRAEPAFNGKVRLKYLAISGGCGPELSMDFDLARKTIMALETAMAGGTYESE